MPVCTVCGVRVKSVNALYLHCIIEHQNAIDMYRCKENNCLRPFSDWKRFRKHLVTVHKCPVHAPAKWTSGSEETASQNVMREDEMCDDMLSTEEADLFNDTEQISLPFNETKRQILNFASNFVAKYYANPKFPRSLVQNVVEDTQELLECIVMLLKASISSPNSDYSQIQDVLEGFCSAMLEPFGSVLSTEHRRFKFFEESGCFIRAQDYIVGDELQNVLCEGRIIQERRPLKAKIVPMREVLKQLFSMPGLLESIDNYIHYLQKEKESGIVSNFLQGKLWEGKKENFGLKTVFPLFLFFDDFEVNNPLGSHAGIQKLGAVYFSLPFLPPEFRSTLDNIFLALLFHSTDRDKQIGGNEKIFKILVDELNFLQTEGIEISVNGKSQRIYFTLGLILGDNLGLNSGLGFVEGFNANFYCRSCKMHKTDCQKSCSENEALIRTEDDYRSDGFQNPSNTGVKENSVWNLVLFYHVVFNFVVDVMHDLLEGVCKYAMGHILYHYLIQKQLFSLHDLNAKLKSFNYVKSNIKNRPPLLTMEDIKNRRIPFSASEMHAFVSIFPFLVSDLFQISCDDQVWKYYLILRQILDLCFAKSLQVECSSLLKSLVCQHHRLYQILFNDTLKPKFHNMLHYGRIMEMVGPLAHLSVMRFESKHKTLKDAAGATSSRLNITHTISLKEQLQLCFRFAQKKGLTEKLEFGSSVTVDSLSYFDNYYFFRDKIPLGFITGTCVQVDWVTLKGVHYRNGNCIVLDLDENPVFGIIELILINDEGRVCFVCKELDTLRFDGLMHAYEVSYRQTKYNCCFPHTLINPFPVLQYCTANGHHYAAPKLSL